MKKQQGFTLIETLIAIFLLTLTVGGLMTMAANGYYSVRYARNQMVADTLLQESMEYIRNSRDTTIQQGGTWTQWVANFNVSSNGTVLGGPNTQGCFTGSGNSGTGCIIDLYASSASVRACGVTCEAIAFYPGGLYGYASSSYTSPLVSGSPTTTTYIRTISMQQNGNPDQVIVNSTIQWRNGKSLKTISQSILMTNWP
jgi:prepilin-type N-terminal cleavage/methylation domain-containing protein